MLSGSRSRTSARGIIGTYVQWDAIEESKTADEALSESLHRGQLDAAKDFLRDFLSEGPRSNREVWAEATAMGLSRRTVDRAKKELEIKSKHNRLEYVWVLSRELCDLPVN
jgi:hypothetical protein